MVTLDKDFTFGSGNTSYRSIYCCPLCGWWKKTQSDQGGIKGIAINQLLAACGSLRELDLTDQTLPLEQIRSYLIAKYDERFHIDPWKFEEVVGSVYRDLGYRVRVTARSGDGGIDVILDGDDNVVIGVQVKRYKNKICIEQIASLAGALLAKGITRGIFVTTSSFQSGVPAFAEALSLRGHPIELVDAKRFYDALKITQRPIYKSAKEKGAPFLNVELVKVEDSNRKHNNKWRNIYKKGRLS